MGATGGRPELGLSFERFERRPASVRGRRRAHWLAAYKSTANQPPTWRPPVAHPKSRETCELEEALVLLTVDNFRAIMLLLLSMIRRPGGHTSCVHVIARILSRSRDDRFATQGSFRWLLAVLRVSDSRNCPARIS
jgi:hypothetical protein